MTNSNLATIDRMIDEREAAKDAEASDAQPEVYGWDMTEVPDAKPRGFQAAMKERGERPGANRKRSKASETEQAATEDICSKIDLLSLAIADTGEQPQVSGGTAYFRGECPICGGHDDFRVYPETNSFACYSDRSAHLRKPGADHFGGNVCGYIIHARHDGDTVAGMTEAHELSGIPYNRADDDVAAQGEPQPDGSGYFLPEWTAIQSTEPPSRNPVLIEGVVRRGHVVLLAGKGKIGKSWSAIELCVSVATGRGEWFGLPLESSGACLFIDPELDPKSLDNRFHTVCEAMGADTVAADAAIAKWSLRGIPGASMNAIIHDLQKRCEFGRFALVVIDSCSCFVEGDENSSVDVRKFSAKVLQVAAITGATVLLVHHFGKAKDGDRGAADRARGSSVWLDFPDAVLTLTEVLPPSGEPSDYLQPGEYACLLESGGIREFPRMNPIRLVFGYPVHRVDADGITESWKPSSSAKDGANATNELKRARADLKGEQLCSTLLAYYYSEGIGQDGLILKEAAAICECDSRTLANAVEAYPYLDLVKVTERKRYVRPTKPPRESPPELELEGD